MKTKTTKNSISGLFIEIAHCKDYINKEIPYNTSSESRWSNSVSTASLNTIHSSLQEVRKEFEKLYEEMTSIIEEKDVESSDKISKISICLDRLYKII